MNKIISIGILTVTSIFFLSCSSTKRVNENGFQKKPPFKVLTATYSKWIGGQPGVNGISVHISIDNPEILLDTVYFRNNSAKLKLDKSISNPVYVGSFVLPNTNKNFNLDIDPKKEFGNQVPNISQKIPFDLKETEAIISYLLKNKRTYFKISNIIEVSKN